MFPAQAYKDDFYDVMGQEMAKFAALVSASGNHNMILEGSPGCGKSMIAKRVQYIIAPADLFVQPAGEHPYS